MPERRNALYLLAIVCLLAGLFTGRALFFNIAYLLGILLVVSFLWAWLAVRWIGISRKTRARRAQVGRTLDETFTVRNLAILPKLWLEIRDHSELPGHRASQVVPAIGPHGQYRWYVQTPCLARGEFRLGPMTLSSGDPFGLFLSPRKIGATSRVIVYPATVPINKFELPVGILSGGEAQRRRTHFVTTNAMGVREYVSGDSFNRIHWRSSARKDQLMVKEFELDPLVDIYLMVDFSSYSQFEAPGIKRLRGDGPIIPSGPGIPPSTEEYAVVIAASLVNYFIDSQRAVGFLGYTPTREAHEPDRGERQRTRILQSLATARSLSPYTLAQMLTLEAPYLGRGATLIIITSTTDAHWVAEAQILSRRGIKPMCILIDQESFGSGSPAMPLLSNLRLAKIPTYHVHQYDDITAVLQQRPL